jgi:hypothetical protein
MRLINTRTLMFEEFIGRNIPTYAILSHTWEEEEVSFKDMSDPSCNSKKEYGKIATTCRLAAEEGLGYAWVDTCCIDKSSSAELTEAINSMFQWYQRASICYVYLSDLTPSAQLETEFERCRWFTRGWTLQELIAPKNVEFFDQSWSYRGRKHELIDGLARITGINIEVLQRTKPLSSVAVAQKMSWASHRQTTRIEDAAYCLLGIFDVNMAMLYGEEENAFRRLQEEIIKTTPDYSIFAWTTPLDSQNAQRPEGRVFSGVLATSPLQFSKCGSVVMLDEADTRTDFFVSNQGIKMQSRVHSEQIPGKYGIREIFPVCTSETQTTLGIRLRKCGPSQYLREDPFTLVALTEDFWESAPGSRYLLTQLPGNELSFPSPLHYGESIILQSRPHVLQIRLPPEMKIETTWPWPGWDGEDQIFFFSGDSTRDCAAAIISGTLNLHIKDRTIPVSFGCIFYALGWAQLENRCLQCTVIDDSLLEPWVSREMNEKFEKSDHRTDRVRVNLLYYEIPQWSSCAFKFATTKLQVLVSFTTTKIRDPAVCQNTFWRVEFGWKVCKKREVPKIHDGKWQEKGQPEKKKQVRERVRAF